MGWEVGWGGSDGERMSFFLSSLFLFCLYVCEGGEEGGRERGRGSEREVSERRM